MKPEEAIEEIQKIHAHASLVAREEMYPPQLRATMNGLIAVIKLHSPKMLFEMKDGNHEYSCTGCNTPVTTTSYPCETLRELIVSYKKPLLKD